jgi:DNA-binding winged helix-turn-helix (wHTH) protein/tetratricopeptide (TPR) repeat protein/TolB-like protein
MVELSNLESRRTLRTGDVEIDPGRSLIRRGDDDVFVRHQTLRVLLYLIDHRERLVSREELHAAIWGDTAVTPDALVQCIVDIRKAFGDNPKQPKYIRTVPRVGYGFIGPLEDAEDGATVSPPAAAPETPSAPASKRRARTRWPRLLAAAALLAVTLTAVFSSPLISPAPSTAWPARAGHTRIVVLPFSNESGDPTMAWLQNGLPNMLITGLGRSRGASAVALAELRPFPAGEPLPSVEEGRSIARRAHADFVVHGSFTTVGETVRVDIRAAKATGEMLGTDFVVASRRDGVLTEVDRLSERLARTLGLRPRVRAAALQLSNVMTKDLDAWRDYVFGVQKASAVEPEAAIALFESAVRRDAEFAMAHARIGSTYVVTMGNPAAGQPHLARAFQLSGRLREVDRLWILAWYSLAKLDYDGAVASLATLTAKYPDDLEAYSLLAKVLTGQERWTEAFDVIERGLAIDPDAKDLHNVASSAATGAGRAGDALDAARRYVAVAPYEANARDTLGLRLQNLGRYDEAIEAYQEALRINPRFDIALAHMGNAYFAAGRYDDAAAAYEQFMRTTTGEDNPGRALGALAWIAFRRGDRTRAWRLAERAATLSERDPWPALVIAIDRRDAASYRRIRERTRWDKYSSRGTPWPRILENYMRALDLRIEGRHDEALARLRDAVRHPPLGWAMESLADCLAEACFELGRWDEARLEYERLARVSPWIARYHYRLAQLADRRGDEATAVVEYQRFVDLWRNADADLPEVIAARARLTESAHPARANRRE